MPALVLDMVNSCGIYSKPSEGLNWGTVWSEFTVLCGDTVDTSLPQRPPRSPSERMMDGYDWEVYRKDGSAYACKMYFRFKLLRIHVEGVKERGGTKDIFPAWAL